jgi:hypothetical protein
MKHFHRRLLFYILAAILGAALFSYAQAQEETYRIEYTDIFGKLRRPAIDFSHDLHAEALEEAGCGACHHAPDENTGKLVYIEDEEVSCTECHGLKEEDSKPALREAFHGSCTPCHRKMIKEKISFKGPTTCGECHIPATDTTQP